MASTQGFRPPEPSGLTLSVPLCACRHVGTGSGQTPSGGHKVRIHEEPEPLQEGWRPQSDLTQRARQRVPAPGTGASEDPSPRPGPDSSTLVCGSQASAPGAGPPAAGTGQSSVRESHRKGNTRTPTPRDCPAFQVSGDTPRACWFRRNLSPLYSQQCLALRPGWRPQSRRCAGLTASGCPACTQWLAHSKCQADISLMNE